MSDDVALSLSEEQQATWASLVGKLILNCGAIENLVNLLLLQWSTDDALVETALDQPYAKRLRTLERLVNRHAMSDGERKALGAALSNTRGLFEVRNTVAHNPVVVGTFGSEQIIAIPRFKGKGRMYDGAVATVSLKEIAIAVQGLIASHQIIAGFVTNRPTLTVTVERPQR